MKSIRQTAWEINEWGERELETLFSSFTTSATFSFCWDAIRELAKRHEWYTNGKSAFTRSDEAYRPFYALAVPWMREKFPERYAPKIKVRKDLPGQLSMFDGVEDGRDNSDAQY